MQVQVDPSREFVPQSRGTHASGADSTGLTGGLQLRSRKGIHTLALDDLVVAAEVQEAGADETTQEVVCAERVETHVATHGRKLGS